MFVSTKDMYTIKRFLHINKGVVAPFKKNTVNPIFGIENVYVLKALKTLVSTEYVMKIGNWQHGWYFVTEEGEKKLKEEVGLPDEKRQEEMAAIKN